MVSNRQTLKSEAVENGVSRDLEAPLVSVVIPCYKQAHFLPEAIESVLKQSYTHREIVVVDDGSPDNTAEVARRYPGVHCLSQENAGLANARNAGLRVSQGKYVVFLDADDRLASGALQIGVDFLNARPHSAFVFGECRRIDVEGRVVPRPDPPPRNEDSYLELLHHCFIWCPASVMHRKEVLLEIGGFRPNLNGTEDYDLYLRISCSLPVSGHGRVVADYRLYEGSMSTNAELTLKSLLYIFKTQRNYINGNPAYERAYREGLRQTRRYYGSKLLQNALKNLENKNEPGKLSANLLALLRFYPSGLAEYVAASLRAKLKVFR